MWIQDRAGNLIAVFGESEIVAERVGDKVVFRVSCPVLYRRDPPAIKEEEEASASDLMSAG